MGCESNVKNPSTSCNNPQGLLKKLIFAKESVSFPDHASALPKAAWDALVQSKDIIPMEEAMLVENQKTDTGYEETSLGTAFTNEGKDIFKYNITSNLDLHSKIRSLNNSGYTKMFEVYSSGVIVGTKTADADTIYPLSIALMRVESWIQPEEGVTGKTPIRVQLEDMREKNDNPVLVVPTWNVFRLNPLTNVQLQVVSASATSVVVNAYVPHANLAFKNPVEGLVAADFLLTTAAGVVETIGGVTEDANVPGKYTITGTGLVTGFVNLKLPSLMTTKGFESVGQVAKTVA